MLKVVIDLLWARTNVYKNLQSCSSPKTGRIFYNTKIQYKIQYKLQYKIQSKIQCKILYQNTIPKYYGHITSQFEDDSKGFPTAASRNGIGLKNRPRFFEKSNLIEF